MLPYTCFIFFLLGCSQLLCAQFAPPAGQAGSTAIAKDSSIIQAWASQCSVERGWQDISQPQLGRATSGTAAQATGAAGDGLVVSLGDSGVATLTFDYPIRNGLGADFVVFENAFSPTFLELAFVEVSSDGQNYVRFPAISNTDTSQQIDGFGHVDATKVYNLAGKYRAGFGTPFDLEELVGDSAILDVNAVTHVRLVDVVGSINPLYGSRDSRGHLINDPWNTPFPTGGFDLDAVGVIHNNTNIAVAKLPVPQALKVWPNPSSSHQAIQISLPETLQQQSLMVTWYNWQGQTVLTQIIHTSSSASQNSLPATNLPAGWYILSIETPLQHYYQKIQLRS